MNMTFWQAVKFGVGFYLGVTLVQTLLIVAEQLLRNPLAG